MDLSVAVNNKDSLVANIKETYNKIPFGIDVNDIVVDDSLNYDFQVVSIHVDDEANESIETFDSSYDSENKVVTFESNKFSTYLISYKTSVKNTNTKNANVANSNTAVQNPKTFDGIVISVIVGLVSFIGLIKTVKTIEKRG